MQATISRRSALKLLAVSGSAVLLAACGPGAPPPSAAPPAPTATNSTGSTGSATIVSTAQPSSAPKSGGTVRVGLASEPANVDGHIRTPARI